MSTSKGSRASATKAPKPSDPALDKIVPEAEPDLSRFANASKDSRDAAKWLLAGFGAIAAVMIAGTQLSSLGSLSDLGRASLAVIALTLGLTAVALAAALTMWLLLPGYMTLASIKDQEGHRKFSDFAYVGDVLTVSPELAEGHASSVAELQTTYEEALIHRKRALDAYIAAYQNHDSDEEARQRAFKAADLAANELGRICDTVVAVASYRRVNRGSHAWVAAVTALALVIGASIGAFAWAANPPKPGSSTAVTSFRGVSLSGVDLSGRDLSNVDFTGARLSDVTLAGTTLTESLLVDVTWTNVTCPDGFKTGPTGGTCLGHLK